MYGDQRQELRQALARDQGSLCAYCQRRVTADEGDMRIDHWQPRAGGGQHFQWSNLVGSCSDAGTCDAHKGSSTIWLDPYGVHGPQPNGLLRYLGDGRAVSDDNRVAEDVTRLNLNADHLIRGRLGAVRAARKWMQRQRRTKGELGAKVTALQRGADAKRDVFAFVLAQRLERYLSKRP